MVAGLAALLADPRLPELFELRDQLRFRVIRHQRKLAEFRARLVPLPQDGERPLIPERVRRLRKDQALRRRPEHPGNQSLRRRLLRGEHDDPVGPPNFLDCQPEIDALRKQVNPLRQHRLRRLDDAVFQLALRCQAVDDELGSALLTIRGALSRNPGQTPLHIVGLGVVKAKSYNDASGWLALLPQERGIAVTPTTGPHRRPSKGSATPPSKGLEIEKPGESLVLQEGINTVALNGALAWTLEKIIDADAYQGIGHEELARAWHIYNGGGLSQEALRKRIKRLKEKLGPLAYHLVESPKGTAWSPAVQQV